MDMRKRSSANIALKKRKLRPVTFTCAQCLSKSTFSRAPALVLPPCLAEARREYQRELIRKGRSRQKAIANFFGRLLRRSLPQLHPAGPPLLGRGRSASRPPLAPRVVSNSPLLKPGHIQFVNCELFTELPIHKGSGV